MKLATLVQPLVSRNMTRNELVRAAEHAFPNPTLIVHLVLEHLRGHVGEPASSTALPPGGLHCPACGAGLQLDMEDNA